MTNEEITAAHARRSETGRLSRFLGKYSQPRFQLFLIILVTAAIGAAASFLLLRAGLSSMGLRYPCAAGMAYLAFLGLLRVWAYWHLGRAVEALKVSALDQQGASGASPTEGSEEAVRARKRSGWDWDPLNLLDFTSSLDDLPILIVVIALATAITVVSSIIVVAPVLLAELFLDALLVAGLWHRVTRYGGGSSLGSAVRATFWPAVTVTVCLSVIGFAMQVVVPSADSIGDVFGRR